MNRKDKEILGDLGAFIALIVLLMAVYLLT